ncbi:MAG TPA: C4-dicarboxylate ABC transporter substrate-binding protein, partial [Firmicutes bacterium]|nr:C4-dicarboxylate ABC transporter substrate-binding protein [Bacillota bacterium]
EEWAKRVEERTGGQVLVETFPGGTLLGAMNMYDGVLEGVAEIGLSVPSHEPGRFPILKLAELPVRFPNSKVASVVLYELVQEFQPAELKDFKVITMFATEPAYIQSKTRVASLADLRGLELRSAGGGVSTLTALGATPVGMPMSEVPEALQTGVIEGNTSSREVLYDFKIAEIVKYVTDYPLFYVAFAAVMDIDQWNLLPADVQGVINELGREMALWAGEYLDNHVNKALDWAVKEQGVEIVTLSAEEKAKWDAALQPLVETTVEELEKQGLPARAFMNRLFELRDKYSKEFS